MFHNLASSTSHDGPARRRSFARHLARIAALASYERSAAQYHVIRDSVVQPDPVRLHYRDELRTAVRGIIMGEGAPSLQNIRKLAEMDRISIMDLSRFSDVIFKLLLNLNEGSAARYGLRPSELSG